MDYESLKTSFFQDSLKIFLTNKLNHDTKLINSEDFDEKVLVPSFISVCDGVLTLLSENQIKTCDDILFTFLEEKADKYKKELIKHISDSMLDLSKPYISLLKINQMKISVVFDISLLIFGLKDPNFIEKKKKSLIVDLDKLRIQMNFSPNQDFDNFLKTLLKKYSNLAIISELFIEILTDIEVSEEILNLTKETFKEKTKKSVVKFNSASKTSSLLKRKRKCSESETTPPKGVKEDKIYNYFKKEKKNSVKIAKTLFGDDCEKLKFSSSQTSTESYFGMRKPAPSLKKNDSFSNENIDGSFLSFGEQESSQKYGFNFKSSTKKSVASINSFPRIKDFSAISEENSRSSNFENVNSSRNLMRGGINSKLALNIDKLPKAKKRESPKIKIGKTSTVLEKFFDTINKPTFEGVSQIIENRKNVHMEGKEKTPLKGYEYTKGKNFSLRGGSNEDRKTVSKDRNHSPFSVKSEGEIIAFSTPTKPNLVYNIRTSVNCSELFKDGK